MRSRTEGADCVSSGERQTERRLPPPTARLNNYQRPMRTPVGGARRTPRGGEEQRDERHIGRGECRYVSTTQ